MQRRTFLLGVSGALAGCYDSSRRLNVFNWDSYVAPDTISTFERRFRCRVRYGVYSGAEEMLAKVLGGNSGWDVVFPSNYFVQPMRELQLLAPLDRSRLRNLHCLNSTMRRPEWDGSLQWSVPYMQGATGIIYSRRSIDHHPAWADLWTDRYRGRMTMLDDPAEVFGAALRRLGASVNAESPDLLLRARNLALTQRDKVRAYLNEEARDQVVAGDLLAAQMWAQVAHVAIAASSNLAFSYPAEGFPLYADCACILRESRRAELAHAFIDYLLEPQVAADITTYIRGATPNANARELLAPALREDPVLYPAAETLTRGEWFRPLSPAAQRLRDRYWTEVRSG